MKIRNSSERGFFSNEWLKSHHTFSFSDYFDRQWMHFSDLRVINHDFVEPETGFGTHPHQNMEIISYVLNGTVEHKDSMGNKKQIRAGEIQVMSAGTGVMHSEYNPDQGQAFELIQIWILPSEKGGQPFYDQKAFSKEDRLNQLLKIISPIDAHKAQDESLRIKQDASIYASIIQSGFSVEIPLLPTRSYWLQVANGDIEITSTSKALPSPLKLDKGSGLALEAGELSSMKVSCGNAQTKTESEILLFELRPN